jgi:hypothetical protein
MEYDHLLEYSWTGQILIHRVALFTAGCRSEAELFSKLASAKSRSKAGEKLPAAEMKEP